MFSLFSAFVNQKELKIMKLENYYVCFLIYTSVFGTNFSAVFFRAPINLNSPVALRLKYPWYQTLKNNFRPTRNFFSQNIWTYRKGFLQQEYMILYELYVQDSEMHISLATYFPSLGFAFKIRYPNLPPPPQGTKLNKLDVT